MKTPLFGLKYSPFFHFTVVRLDFHHFGVFFFFFCFFFFFLFLFFFSVRRAVFFSDFYTQRVRADTLVSNRPPPGPLKLFGVPS